MKEKKEKKILICPKISKYEWDLHKYRISNKELIEKYKKEKVDYENILLSHERQLKSRALTQKLFSKALVIEREHLTKEDIKNVDITISLGGDNHFQYVSHFIENELILGINSDSLISEGVLLSCATNNIENLKEKLDTNNFKVEKWTRLDVFVNNNFFSKATCDIFIGEKERAYMSRYVLIYKGIEYQQKSSGILISTGCGSTGWFSSASRNTGKNLVFDRTSEYAMFIITEPYNGNLTDSSLKYGKIDMNISIKIYSLNNNGTVNIDSLEKMPFPRGKTAEIKISNFPLNVIRF